jgi:hypothetical protein
MTCHRALDVIDAAPFVDRSSPLFKSALDHANQCKTCGPALATAAVLTSRLRALPQLSVPADLRSVVMARIARIDSVSVPARGAQTHEREWVTRRLDWAAWIQLCSFAVTLALILQGSLLGTFGGAQSPRTLTEALTDALVVAGSLTVYFASLNLPLRSHR